MKRILSFSLLALLSIVLTTVHAQRTVFIWKNGGNLCVEYSVDSLTFIEKTTDLTYTLINGHKFVDLGLPSGLLWADSNVGASSPTDDGGYFAWGEIESKDSYLNYNYKWGECSDSLSKYNQYDNKTILDTEDDVATVKWGIGCRLPSSSEFDELRNECDWLWLGNGYHVTGPNGNTIFLPASGYFYEKELKAYGTEGNYWSRSLSSLDYCALYTRFGLGYIANSFTSVFYGFSVRPVANK